MNNLTMRDDFPQKTKETLAKRVAYHCSNPECKLLTIGPNSDKDKASNIGVAAHITAASVGGPRYDAALTPEQRADIDNGIWLCQSCAKLVDSDAGLYTVELLKAWKVQAEFVSSRKLNVQNPNTLLDKFLKVKEQMPELIKEMQEDLNENPLIREFILQYKGTIYNGCGVTYFYESHTHLEQKMHILVNQGFIEDIQYNSVKRYRMGEEFVEMLLNAI
jgi:hypothetical protein